MRKIIIFLLFFVAVFGYIKTPLLAQERDGSAAGIAPDMGAPEAKVDSLIYPSPDYLPRSGFVGQDHRYSVVFRGNGETAVSLKVIFANRGSSEINEVKLRIPKVEPKEIFVYQVFVEPLCIRYREPIYDTVTQRYLPINPPVCEEYGEPDFYNLWNAKYQKAESEYKGDTLTIKLPEAVKPNSSASYLVHYKVLGYTTKNILGAYKYSFESLQVEDDIMNLSLGISTDSDLYLKGVRTDVNYRLEESALAMPAIGMGAVPQKDAAMDRFISQIGYGTITKTASNLSPLETYTVNGAYADNRAKLYGVPIAISIAAFAVAVLFIFVLLKFMIRKIKESADKTDGKTGKAAAAFKYDPGNFLTIAGISFASSLFIAVYTIFIMLAGRMINNFIGYEYEFFFVLMAILISLGIYTILLFGPAIFIGIKKGAGWGISTILITIVWLFIYMVIGIIVVFFLGPTPAYPVPLPY